MKRFFALTLIFLAAALGSTASVPLTYRDIATGKFAQKSIYGLRSMQDGAYYTVLRTGQIVKFRYADGAETAVLFDPAKISPKISVEDYQFSGDERFLLLTTKTEPIYRHSFTAQYYLYDIAQQQLTPLSDQGAQQVASFSPDGTKVAFVRDNNLFVTDIASHTETRLTDDGKFNFIINGIPDWVYEEEFAFSQGYQWSPDSKRIAYLRFDESRVKSYNMNRFDQQLYPGIYGYKYPKAGEQNSIVSVYTCTLDGQRTRIDVGNEDNQYIPRIRWTARGELAVYRVNRLQNHFELLLASADGSTRKIYDETDSRYVERIDDETVTFLSDGDRFIVKNESNGYKHLYLYSIKKGLINRITTGAWEVAEIKGVDEKRGLVYYLSTEQSPLCRDLYSVRLNGKDKKRLTHERGTYRIDFSADFSYYISQFSNSTTPNVATLHKSTGTQVRVLEDNAPLRARLKEYALPTREFFTFTTAEGSTLNGWMIKPRTFDPSKKYPVFLTQYSGPGSQSVADRWTLSWEEVLVENGYIVVCVDGRGTGFRGKDFRECTYENLGKFEVEDQIYTAQYMASQPYVDASRLGIYGWSYGGFMSLNCILKGNDIFKMAIAIAPVTNWRYYDTIYTEIFNGLPQDNPKGYDENSPIFFADRLKGKLLICHGTGDDNVHIQNTMEMTRQLVKAGRQFDMMYYTDDNHSMYPMGRHHLMEKCIEYVKANL